MTIIRAKAPLGVSHCGYARAICECNTSTSCLEIQESMQVTNTGDATMHASTQSRVDNKYDNLRNLRRQPQLESHTQCQTLETSQLQQAHLCPQRPHLDLKFN